MTDRERVEREEQREANSNQFVFEVMPKSQYRT